MAGVPLLLGFVAKEADLDVFVGSGAGAAVALAGIVAGSALTAAYSIRFVAGVAGRLAPAGTPAPPADHGPPRLAFVLPAVVLAALTLVYGVVPALVDPLVSAAATALDLVTDRGPPRGVARDRARAAALRPRPRRGCRAVRARRRVDPVLAVGAHVPRALDAYRASLRGVEFGADRVTTVAQPGSLPIYLGVILLTAAVVPGALLLSGTWWPGWPDLVDLPVHVPLAALMIALALAAAIVRRRFSGALFLGMVGYTMAGLFIVQGAPDLALTQVAIETLTTVLFVLVLRRLPDRFETATGAARRAVRVVVATAVGGDRLPVHARRRRRSTRRRTSPTR